MVNVQRSHQRQVIGARESVHISKAILLEEAGIPVYARSVVWLGLIAVLAFFCWAYFARLEVVAQASGEILPAGSVQVIQHIDGGRLSAIDVSDGDFVRMGQPLVHFNNVQVMSEYHAFLARYWSLFIQTERLRALAFNRSPNFDAVPTGYEQLISEQELLLQVAQQQVAELREQIDTLEEILEIQSDLAVDQLVARVQVMGAERELGDAQLEHLNFNRITLDELNASTAQLSEVKEQLIVLEERLARTVLVSPVDGIVQELQFNTIGGVVPPGDTLMQIVPIDDRLEAELRVSPTDIGFVTVGQPVNVKVGAFDFMRYGTIGGTVNLVSSYSSVDDQNVRFFRVIVALESDQMPSDPNKNIGPGMTVQADIVLDSQTVLAYLMRPFVVAFDEGLGER